LSPPLPNKSRSQEGWFKEEDERGVLRNNNL
jgi:hypothetical protein